MLSTSDVLIWKPSVHKVEENVGAECKYLSRGKRSSPTCLEATEEPLGIKAEVVVDFWVRLSWLVSASVSVSPESVWMEVESDCAQQRQKKKIYQTNSRDSAVCRKIRVESSRSASTGQSLSHSFLVN